MSGDSKYSPAPVSTPASQLGFCTACGKPVDTSNGFQIPTCKAGSTIHYACVACSHCSAVTSRSRLSANKHEQTAIESLGEMIRVVVGFSDKEHDDFLRVHMRNMKRGYTVSPMHYESGRIEPLAPLPKPEPPAAAAAAAAAGSRGVKDQKQRQNSATAAAVAASAKEHGDRRDDDYDDDDDDDDEEY